MRQGEVVLKFVRPGNKVAQSQAPDRLYDSNVRPLSVAASGFFNRIDELLTQESDFMSRVLGVACVPGPRKDGK